jgi:hypothetical protein
VLRAAVLICLAASSLGILGAGAVSHAKTLYGDVTVAYRDWVYLHLENGFVRVAWLTSSRPFRLDIDRQRRYYTFTSRCAPCEYPTIHHASACELRRAGLGMHEIRWGQRFRPREDGCAPVYLSLVRTRAWTVALLFAAIPVATLLRRTARKHCRSPDDFCIRHSTHRGPASAPADD